MSGGADLGDFLGLIEFLTVFCIIAAVLNLFVVIIQMVREKPRSTVEIFIINVCISDLILAGIALPGKLVNASKERHGFIGGDVVCKMVMFVPQLTISASISTMVAIAADRYREIVKRQTYTTKNVVFILAGIWIWSFVLSSPHLYEYSIKEQSGEYNVTSCGSHDIIENFETIYASVFIALAFVIPLVVISISYTNIAVYVWKNVDGQTSETLNVKMRTVKIVVIITAVFVLLWSPWFVLFGIAEVLGLDDTMHYDSWLHAAKNVMVVFSTLSNPIIYIISDSRFRKDVVKIFTGGVTGSNQVNPEPVEGESSCKKETEVMTIHI